MRQVLFTRVPVPLIITSLHFALKIPLARATMAAWRLPPPAFPKWHHMLLSVVPLGLVTSADVALSNVGLMFVSVTMYTIIKSSSPVFNLLFSICLGVRQPRLDMLLVVACVSAGLAHRDAA